MGERKLQSRSVPLLLTGYAGLLFIAVFTTLGVLVPSYDPLQETISGLEITPLGWAQQANFLVFGVFLFLFAWALHRELQGGRGGLAIPFFQALSGLGVMGDGIFLWPTAAHNVWALIAFNAALCVLFLFAWRVWNDVRWRGWATGSILTAVAMMGFLFSFGMLNRHGGAAAGLMEKMATAVRTLWSVALTSRLLSGATLVPANDTVLTAIK